LKLDIKYEN